MQVVVHACHGQRKKKKVGGGGGVPPALTGTKEYEQSDQNR